MPSLLLVLLLQNSSGAGWIEDGVRAPIDQRDGTN